MQLVQFNYNDILPDGILKGCCHPASTFAHDIDCQSEAEQKSTVEKLLAKKEEIGLLELSGSANYGVHAVCRRAKGKTILESQVRVAQLTGTEMDTSAHDLQRVMYTGPANEENLFYLDDAIFEEPMSIEESAQEFEVLKERERKGEEEVPEGAKKANKHFNARDNETPDNVAPTISKGVTSLEKVNSSQEYYFKDIPYSAIIQEWWRQNGGEPAEGERNVKLHKLAVNLRSICDNKRDKLLAVMPRFGLSEEEMKGIVDSACKEEPKGISRVISDIVDNLKQDVDADEFYDVEKETPTIQNIRSLPIGLKESLVGVPETMHMPLLCGVLPIAAAYADQVTVKYCDGNLQRLGLMSIIHGEQASGKSVVKNAVDVWKRQFDEEDALARKREDEWKEQKKRRKANEKAPEDPHVLIRMVPVTVSCSTLLKRFKNSNEHTLYSFCEELDTLRKTNGAGSWSSKYDIYRLSFDNGEWGQDYNSDQAESGVVNVAYNWTMLGTDGALRKCFKSDNIENGLSSRVLVSEMPDSSFAKMPKFGRRTADDEARIQEAVTKLRSYSGYIDTPRLRGAIEKWVEEKRVEAAKNIDRVKDTYRKRAAVIGFRCGVVFHLLTGLKRESKACVEFAQMMAEYALDQQIKAFGAALEEQHVEAKEVCRRYGVNHSVFDQLPPVFTMEDLRSLKQGFCSNGSLRMIISRWNQDGWTKKTDSKHWKKAEVKKV
ncbi:MAG: DUF3987 domain-containing protein [Prevotella sp.]|nr:DUF3987 domain-containing protein [Prevotella sp.]